MKIPKTKQCILDLNRNWITLWLNRPQKRNALSEDLIIEIDKTLDFVKKDSSVRGLIFRGKGNVFCAGADLKWMQDIAYQKDNAKNKAMKMSMKFGNIFNKISEIPKITISVVDGHCMAGAVGIACATDFLVSTADAKYALTETRIGLTPAQIAPYILKKAGFNSGKKLMLLGDVLNGNDAFLMGMVDYVVKDRKDLDNKILEIMQKVEKCSPNAIAVTKNLINLNYNIDAHHAAKLFSECIIHKEGHEGFQSFFEKRKPFWNTKDYYET